MSKYHRLTAHLANLDILHWRASFDEIEQILGFELPASAYEHPAWWANQAGGHAQSSSWQDAGWRTESLDLGARFVTFTKPLSKALAEIGPKDTKRPFLNGVAPAARTSDHRFLAGITESARPLSIAQAKAGLAANFGVSEDNIEIIIKG